MCATNVPAVVLIVVLFVPFVSLMYLDVGLEAQEQCVQVCRSQNRTDHCDDTLDCRAQCEDGCTLWKMALNESCQKVCNSTEVTTLSQKEFNCALGCNDALTRYYTQLRKRLGTPPPPALVADSLTATSLRLEWNFRPKALEAGVRYFLQWRYEEHAGAWQYCRNQTWGPQETVFVTNLQPYTKYRFRVALILSPLTDPIVSPPSVVISTRPEGVPASAPVIVRAVPVDSTRISVSWEPGPFPHGPLLSYMLRISDNQPHGYQALKELPAENNFYMVRNLSPNHNYTISITMRNGVGLGPAASVNVSTPLETKLSAKHSEKPVLILAANHVVIEQGIDVLAESVILYNTNEFINGLAIHVQNRLLFVSESSGYIYRRPLYEHMNNSVNTIIISPSQINFVPLDLSMDWLNEHLYILGEVQHQTKVWQIARCSLSGHGLTVAVAGLRTKPHHVEVDPFNGYLFWVTTNGLYRLDLADISNGIKHEVQPELIFAGSNLGAFTVDHTNFSLLIAIQNKSTVYSVSLDGKEMSNMRPKITTSRLQKVVSLVSANKMFYWTNGDEVLYEEYHPSSMFFHNSYPLPVSNYYIKVLVNLTSSQPVPVPVNPPTSVQAIFGTNIAKTSWMTPHLLGSQGKGAWQNWSYEISIRNMRTQETRLVRDINSTSFTITGLDESTEYIVKCAAYTSFGKGPWSTEFIGRSLKANKDGRQPLIFWSAYGGLLKSDASGENVETLIPKIGQYLYNDIAWFRDNIYLVANNTRIILYNMTSHTNQTLQDIDAVSSVAVDWIGRKLYWSNPKQQLIIRSNLQGGQQESLPFITMAKELNIDSVKAYIYWSAVHTVECSHLNGADRMVYHNLELFSGRQVMGLTLDMDHQLVYWIVRDSDGSTLFSAPMAGSKPGSESPAVQEVASLQKPSMSGPLSYFNNRLIWLQDDRSAVISDLKGHYAASISGKSLMDLNMMYVLDSSQQVMPNATKHSTIKEISVLPEIIDKSSVRVFGSWNTFNITWKPVQNVNFGTVFYEIRIDTVAQNDTMAITTFPTIKYNKPVMPFTKLHVSLRAFTYWGSSSQVRIKVHSPPSTPSAPGNPRAYVEYQHLLSNTTKINITFRWDSPVNTNGVLEGYKVFWQRIDGDNMYNDSAIVDAFEKEYIIGDLLANQIYSLQVAAYTEIGDGSLSEPIEINTSNESPVPTLLVAASNSIYRFDVDKDRNYPLIADVSTPIKLDYLFREHKIFWINDMQEILMHNLINLNRTRVHSLGANAVSLTGLSVDWIERSLYYVQIDEFKGSEVYRLDLNYLDKGLMKNVQLFRTPQTIKAIAVSPFTKKLYWTAIHKSQTTLMQANTDGSDITEFFAQNEDSCNCSDQLDIKEIFAVDHSIPLNNPSIVFINSSTRNIIKTDKEGCNCEILNIDEDIRQSIPVDELKIDFHSIFWTSKRKGLSFTFQNNGQVISKTNGINSNDIAIYGSHMQPYPSINCLYPQIETNQTVLLHEKSSNSLTLKMPGYRILEDCLNVSMATVKYMIYYMPYNDEQELRCDDFCTQNETFEQTIEISNLRPHSRYMFSVSLSNYFSDLREERVYIGPAVVFQTSPGAPSPPRNVDAINLNPTLVKVTWIPPEELNGDQVYYVIHWQNEGLQSGIRQTGEQTVMPDDLKDLSKLTAYLTKLSPNETYSIWVRASSVCNMTSGDSNMVKLTTLPEPNNITLLISTSRKLTVQWNVSKNVEKYTVEFAPLTAHEWIALKSPENITNVFETSIEDLKPKMQYKFRVSLKYFDYEQVYVWPKDTRFTFETLGDKPTPPGVPVIQHITMDLYQVWWEASKDNGAPIEMYMLETLKTPNYRTKRSTNRTAWFSSAPSVEEENFVWESLYNGTDTFWRINSLPENFRYAFRVSALNSYGWSNPSEESLQFDPTTAAQLTDRNQMLNLILAITVPVLFTAVILFVCRKVCCSHHKKDHQIIKSNHGPDVELATLRELPRRGNFIHNTNVLYISTQPTSEEITLLPHIRRDQITLMKFLGSGAFGEVFEGKAKGLTANNSDIKVAVKTLRKGASEQEKSEFLQEAQLMSHFKHEHILQLLGVCLDNDPHFIIMELMEGGDLLTYLRSSRKSGSNSESLNLLVLIKMCVDVAKGCRYLEEMHFVHRDLACRNCLVSSTDPETRIVKIGDFGLARDIYKNDYYRKEGEGLLPVRWMAPESLVDGVFTSQSDVWAFGVLLWEIMTLGGQPYPARNNMEVLHYVRDGGRLGKPKDCPESLHNLMLSCWSYEADLRPTFKFCLDDLLILQTQMANSPMTGAHTGQYISTVPLTMDGISNQAYFQDENHNNNSNNNNSGASWKSGGDQETRERTPFLQNDQLPAEIPKYLELVYDANSPVENDGYEVPRKNDEDKQQPRPPVVYKEANGHNVECLLNVGYTNMSPEKN